MRMALAFRRPDVDGLLSEIPADEYAEWQAFFLLEPIGWPALQMIVRRIVWAIFQAPRNEQVDEFPFMTRAEAMLTPEQQRIRDQIDAIKNKARVDAALAEQAAKRN